MGADIARIPVPATLLAALREVSPTRRRAQLDVDRLARDAAFPARRA
jgi:hypothetical protein